LKLKRIKTCARSAPGQHLSKVLTDRQSSEGSSGSRSGSERGLILKSRSSGQITPLCAETLQRVQKSRNLSRFQRGLSSGGKVPFCTQSHSCKESQKSRHPLVGKSLKISGGTSSLECRRGAEDTGFTAGAKAKTFEV
jgi:hypothetical protein